MNFYSVEDTFKHVPALPQGALLEFGVLSGSCMRRIIAGALCNKYHFDAVYGFDSWQGLPEEAANVWRSPDWPAGAFNLKKDFNLATSEDCIEFVTNRILEYVDKKDLPPLEFFSGFFSQSLTPYLGATLADTVSYCHVDVDLYISTKQCCDWLFKNNILKRYALVRYDDWIYNGAYAGNNRAHFELTKKYNINWQPVADNAFIYMGHD